MLSGFKVISFNHFHARPMAAQLLADMGSDVLAVDPLDCIFHRTWAVVTGQRVNLLPTSRNKRSLVLDMKSEAGITATGDFEFTAHLSPFMRQRFAPFAHVEKSETPEN